MFNKIGRDSFLHLISYTYFTVNPTPLDGLKGRSIKIDPNIQHLGGILIIEESTSSSTSILVPAPS